MSIIVTLERKLDAEVPVIPNFIKCQEFISPNGVKEHVLPIEDFTDLQLSAIADEWKNTLLERAKERRAAAARADGRVMDPNTKEVKVFLSDEQLAQVDGRIAVSNYSRGERCLSLRKSR